MAEIAQSKANYVVDADGNTMLDMASAEANPLGYNHDIFKPVMTTKAGAAFDSGTINAAVAQSAASITFQDEATATL